MALKGKLTEIASLVRLKYSVLSEDLKSNSGCIPQVAKEIKHVSKNIIHFYIKILYI